MDAAKNALILFFKYPEIGCVKTRLAKILGKTYAYDIYNSLLLDLYKNVSDVKADKIICYSITDMSNFKGFDVIYKSFQQEGNDLGERMYNAFTAIFSAGYERAVLVGSDCPDLNSDAINDAFLKLFNHDYAIGPSVDGGYYLISAQADSINKSIFENISWSTSQVLSQTVDKLESLQYEYILLEKLDDIDDIRDLRNYYHDNIDKIFSQTIKTLSTILED